MIEVEMVQHDVESLAVALLGNQTKSIDDGIYTYYNFKMKYINNTTYTRLKIDLLVNHYLKLERKN
jgi:hypothetical protein